MKSGRIQMSNLWTGRIHGWENSDFYISIDTAFWVHLFYFTE